MKFKRNYNRGERAEQLNDAKEMLRDARDMEDFITHDILDHTQVFVATPVYVKSDLLRNRKFNTVFIDEAAQMLEPAAWIAVSKAQRVVFAGDHCQLSPTVKSLKAAKLGLEETLFEKFYGRQLDLGIWESSQLLNIQYRMCEQIMQFSNSAFYQSKLIAHDSVKYQKLIPQQPNDVINQALEFIDTAGCGFSEQINPETLSYFNPEEAQILIKHLLNTVFTLRLHPQVECKIGVISPYKSQMLLLKELVNVEPSLRYANPRVVVDTIDGFQGQECDVIYISLVRSNDKNEVGFLKDTRRMNVAMTRAKKKLVIVGDSATIGANAFYNDFLEYINQIDAYKSAWEYIDL